MAEVKEKKEKANEDVALIIPTEAGTELKLGGFDFKDHEEGIDLKTSFHVFEAEGEILEGYIIGAGEVDEWGDKTGTKKKPAIKLMNKDREIKILGDKVLVSSLIESARAISEGRMTDCKPVRIIFKGWIEGKEGEYRDFSIRPLIAKRKK